jgi:hypothetical protein
MDVLKVEAYTFSKGNSEGHFTVTEGSLVLKELRKPEPVFTT